MPEENHEHRTDGNGWDERVDDSGETFANVEAAIAALYDNAARLGRECRFKLPDDTPALAAFPGDDEPLPLRELVAVVESCPDLLGIEPLKQTCHRYAAHQLPDGRLPHGFLAEGTPYFNLDGDPETPPTASADNAQFMVALAWQVVQHTGDTGFAETIMPVLAKGLQAVPRGERTQLVSFEAEPGAGDCPCSFAPGVRKRGDLLLSSLLLVQAFQQLADIAQHLGRDGDSDMYRAEAQLVAKRVRMYFWDKSPGLFRAATKAVVEPDIWGSVLSVYLNVATSGQLVAISRYCRENFHTVVRDGHLRGLPAGQYWSDCSTPRGEFENGGFWAGATGWLAYTVDILDPQMADRIIVDLANAFTQQGTFKAIGETGIGRFRDYLPGATMALAGIQKMMARRRKREEQAAMMTDF